jgi:hypothetical protein
VGVSSWRSVLSQDQCFVLAKGLSDFHSTIRLDAAVLRQRAGELGVTSSSGGEDSSDSSEGSSSDNLRSALQVCAVRRAETVCAYLPLCAVVCCARQARVPYVAVLLQFVMRRRVQQLPFQNASVYVLLPLTASVFPVTSGVIVLYHSATPLTTGEAGPVSQQ